MATSPDSVRRRPVIRVFISSTFSDLKHERNKLQEKFRDLEAYCQSRRFQFQAIDLRWGVPSEAGLDHRTMRICFDELRRSQEISPRPNFLILLGDRYGWRPLPEEISTDEFARLAKTAAGEPITLKILEQWYRRDDNAVPPVHVLRSRRDPPDPQEPPHWTDFARDDQNRDGRGWLAVQELLWSVVNETFPPAELPSRFEVPREPDSPPPPIVRFQTSATEQEIWNGALRVPDAQQHVFAFVRRIENIEQCLAKDPSGAGLKDFVDLQPDGGRDLVAAAAQQRMLAELKRRLTPEDASLPSNYREITTTAFLKFDDATQRYDVTEEHVKPLCKAVYDQLFPVVRRQIDEYWRETSSDAAAASDKAESVTPTVPRVERELDLEIEAHDRFGEERAPRRKFVGRKAELRRILDYLRGTDRRPLVVYGPSGTGKTALLAHAARLAEKVLGRKPIVRYLGTTPHSGTVRSLLTSLCRQLRRDFGVSGDPPTELRELEDDFVKLLADYPEQPIYLFLDALDQLDDSDQGRQLTWLRYSSHLPLPEHVKLVVSCLSEVPDAEPAGQPLRVLEQRQLTTGGVKIDELTREEAAALLFDRWLRDETGPSTTPSSDGRPRRTIRSKPQRDYLQQCLDQTTDGTECHRPLYLKILYEEARLWRSFAPPPPAFPATVKDLLHGLFHSLRQPEQHGPLVNLALSYVAASRFGLAENELLEILFANRGYKAHLDRSNKTLGHEFPEGARQIPTALWSRLRHDLDPFMAERAAPGGFVLNFYHRQVAEFARRQLLDDKPLTRVRRHRRLADYFIGSAHGPDPAHSFETDSIRGFSESVSHAVCGAQLDRVGALLQDFAFLMGKLRVGLLDVVAEDYRLVADQAPAPLRSQVQVWQAFFQERAHILRRGDAEGPADKILLQLAVEHAEDSPLTLSAEAWLTDGRCDWIWLRRPYRLARIQRDPCRAILEGHTNGIRSATVLSDGRILSCSGELHPGELRRVVVLSDGRMPRSCDNSLRLWDGASGQSLAVMEGHTDIVLGAKQLSTGQILSWSLDNTLRLWDGTSGRCQSVLRGHTDPVWGAVEISNGLLVSWSKRLREPAIRLSDGRLPPADNSLQLWDCISGQLLTVLEGHTSQIGGATSLSDGRVLSWSDDGTLRLWDVTSGKCLAVLDAPDGLIFSRAKILGAMATADDQIVSWSSLWTLSLWDSDTGGRLSVLKGHTKDIRGAKMLSDNQILSWSDDCTLRLWDGANGSPLAVLKGHTDSVVGASAFSDGRILSWSADGTLRLWDNKTGAPIAALRGADGKVEGAEILADSRILFWASDKTLRLWDGQTGQVSAILRGHIDWIVGATGLADGRILSWSLDKTLRLWDGGYSKPQDVLARHNGWVDFATVWSEDRILSSSIDGTFRLWDAQTGKPLETIRQGDVERHHPDWLRAYLLASETDSVCGVFSIASLSRQVHLRHAVNPRLLASWHANSDVVHRCLLADGRSVATQADGQVCLLKLYHGARRVTLNEAATLLGLRPQFATSADIAEPVSSSSKTSDSPFGVPPDSAVLTDLDQRVPSAHVLSESRHFAGGARPHPDADSDKAMRLNIEYQEMIAAWRKLPWYRRMFIPPPAPPEGS